MSDLHAPPTLSEPSTPMWLPALGAFLFLLAGIWWALQPKPVVANAAESADAGAAEAAAPAAAAPAAAAPAMPAGHGIPGH